VTAVHAIVTGEVLIGYEDGKLIHYDQERTKSISDPSCDCRAGVEHGSIIKIHYDHMTNLLIIGFDRGRIHIKKCTQGLRNSLFDGTQRRECCYSLRSNQNLFALECFLVQTSSSEPISPSSSCPSNLEVWCGTSSYEIEVWSLEVAHSANWNTESVDQIRKVQQVPVNTENDNQGVSVKLMSLNDDQTRMAVALATPKTAIIVVVDVEAKQCLKSIEFSQSGMSSYFPVQHRTTSYPG
jgi:acetyl/propionyl-CoA carboxylase alpha subunit